jgi:hypothetical protein
MVKVVNFVRILSILLFLAILGLVYAYLPVMVEMAPEAGVLTIRRENFFYFAAAAFLLINIFCWFLIKMAVPRLQVFKGIETAAWFAALPFVVNVYITFLVGFVGVINNQIHVSLAGYSYLNYLGPFLFFSWLVGLIYLIVKKKQTA